MLRQAPASRVSGRPSGRQRAVRAAGLRRGGGVLPADRGGADGARTCAGRINMASMAAAEMDHYEVLRDALAARGVDVVPAMTQVRLGAGELPPADHAEHLAGGAGQDLRRRRAGRRLLPRDRRRAARRGGRRGARGAVRDRPLAVRRRRGAAAVTASERQRSRLALWSRRLLGEAITQAQYVLADHDELVELVLVGPRRARSRDRVLRPVAAHARRPDAPARAGLI